MSLLKRLWSFITNSSLDVLTQLETVQHKCNKILRTLEDRINLQEKNAIEVYTSLEISKKEFEANTQNIKRLENAFVKASLHNNTEDMEIINNEISIIEHINKDVESYLEHTSLHYKQAMEELNIVKRERDLIKGKLRIATSRYTTAKREQTYLKGSYSYNSIENEVKDITDTVNEAVSRTKAIRTVQQDSVSPAKIIENKYGSSTITIEERLKLLKKGT